MASLILLDTSALLTLRDDEPGADRVQHLLEWLPCPDSSPVRATDVRWTSQQGKNTFATGVLPAGW
jgi:PIN domain nuclease of toxin-antitoxin system